MRCFPAVDALNIAIAGKGNKERLQFATNLHGVVLSLVGALATMFMGPSPAPVRGSSVLSGEGLCPSTGHPPEDSLQGCPDPP